MDYIELDRVEDGATSQFMPVATLKSLLLLLLLLPPLSRSTNVEMEFWNVGDSRGMIGCMKIESKAQLSRELKY